MKKEFLPIVMILLAIYILKKVIKQKRLKRSKKALTLKAIPETKEKLEKLLKEKK